MTKHLQVISGISYFSYWLANLVFELTKYYITVGIMVLIILAFDRYESYLWLLYIVYGFPMIIVSYLTSFLFDTESAAQNFIVCIFFIIGALGGSIILFLRLFDDLKNIAIGISYAFRVVPLFCLTNGYALMLNERVIFAQDFPKSVFVGLDLLSMDYVGMDLLYMGFMFFIYLFIMIMIELLSNKLVMNKYKKNTPNYNGITDEDVKEEIVKCNEDDEKGNDPEVKARINSYSIRVKNVEKTYSSSCCCCATDTKAVRNLSFSLEYGDCFAMLGVNGAGKSTMFKCLTAQEFPERGDLYINGVSISSNFESIRKQIGYCPQIDAIFEDMTVKQNLMFYASIKGIPIELIDSIVNSLIVEMNLFEFVDKLSGNLSGGNKRKLSVAIAMIGNPPIILLDEPSAGMDPEARRYMWAVIHKITKQRKKSSVILTTHSMEEAETLCQRMGIMVRGRFKCLGSASIIKERYGKVSNILKKYRVSKYL